MNDLKLYLSDGREVKLVVDDTETKPCWWRYVENDNFVLENCDSDVTMFSYFGKPQLKYCPYCGKEIIYR